MPRRARIDAAGALHHVMVGGIERGAVFRKARSLLVLNIERLRTA